MIPLVWNLAQAAGAAASGASASDTGDYRPRVFFAFFLVFACIAVYLVASHRKHRQAALDLETLERRVAGLEQRAGSRGAEQGAGPGAAR